MDSLTDKIDDEDIDAVELCAILQCLGFHIRCLETGEASHSQVGVGKTVVINCQASGLHAVLETPSIACSCPVNNQEGGSGFWQISAVSGGRQHDKEFGSSLLGALPRTFRETLTQKLQDIVRSIRINKIKEGMERERMNKSASMVELHSTPEKNRTPLKPDSPSRYRSLDTLTSSKAECDLPLSGPLSKHPSNSESTENIPRTHISMIGQRQGTYTKSFLRDTPKSLGITPISNRRNNKTSSPIHSPKRVILERLLTTEKMAIELYNEISSLVVEFTDERRNNSSMSSLALDVSKISNQKVEAVKNQYASSPNLSRLMSCNDDIPKPNLNRCESASASNLTITKPTPKKDTSIKSKLRRISPNFLYKRDLSKTENKSNLSGLAKPRIATPVRIPRQTPEPSPSLSAKKKFGHIKSTIPRPNIKK